MLRIDFPAKSIVVVTSVLESDYYSISAPAWQIARILDRKITWEDFALTFRMRITRRPDVYQTLVQGFLLMEPEDMNSFCAKFVEIENRRKRIVVDAGGTLYSIDRHCPHQEGDLSQGWLDQGRLWTCPRHRWQFALDKGRAVLNKRCHDPCHLPRERLN
jgi:UDP-MurNAc hydroxylase